MAKSLDQAQAQEQIETNEGTEYSSEDVELAVNFGVKLLNEGKGLELIEKAINQSKDPAQVIGQFLSQVIAKLAEQMRSEYNVDPGIFLAKDGFLDYMIDYIESELGYPEEFSDEIYTQVVEIIKAAAMGPEAPNNVMDPSAAPSPEQQGQQAPAPVDPGMAPPQPGV